MALVGELYAVKATFLPDLSDAKPAPTGVSKRTSVPAIAVSGEVGGVKFEV